MLGNSKLGEPMKIEEKISVTITMELSIKHIEFLRNITKNCCNCEDGEESLIEKELRQDIYKVTQQYLFKSKTRDNELRTFET